MGSSNHNADNTELLIHISAPSRASDDARYRRMANAYLDFKPRRLHGDLQLPAQLSAGDEVRDHLATNHKRTYTQLISQLDSDYHPSQTPSIPEGTRRSTRQSSARPKEPQRQSPSPKKSLEWETPPSFVDDSWPSRPRALPEFSSPIRRLNLYPERGKTPVATIPGQPQSLRTAAVDNLGTTSDSNKEHVSKKAKLALQRQDIAEPEDISSIAVHRNEAVSAQAGHSPAVATENASISDDETSAKCHQTLGNSAAQDLGHTASVGSSIVAHSKMQAEAGPGKTASISDATSMAARQYIMENEALYNKKPTWRITDFEILAPPPTVGTDHLPSTFITKALESLMTMWRLASRYEPAEQTRTPGDFERGHWLVSYKNWPADKKQRTWVFLQGYIGTGKAGWTVSALRDPGSETLKVFCYGEMVRHIYVLIYLASERMLRKTGGVKWMDSENKAVITMPDAMQ